MHSTRTILPLIAGGTLVLAGLGAPAAFAGQPIGGLVSGTPVDTKPIVTGGQCYAKTGGTQAADPNKCRRVLVLKQIGNWIYAGGIIDTVVDRSTGTNQTIAGFHNIFRFDAASGAVDRTYQPQLYKSGMTGAGLQYADSAVTGIAGDGAGNTYVAGSFTMVAVNQQGTGAQFKGVVDLTDTGAVKATFKPQIGNGGGSAIANDVTLVNGKLWIGGLFTYLNAKVAQGSLAIVDPATGKLTGPQVTFGGQVTATVGTKVAAMAVNSNVSKAAVIGNFTTVGGATHDEVVVLDINGDGSANVDPWNSPALAASNAQNCSDTDTWARGVDWSPDNSHFDIAASGGGGQDAYGAHGALCDAFTRFDSTKAATAPPDIVNVTGFDSLFTVTDTGPYVYTGGHNKSLNHAVYVNGVKLTKTPQEDHAGIGAIDTSTGKAVSTFNPSATTGRGAGWAASLSTGAGVYLGGDAFTVGNDTSIQKLAYFPAS